MKWTADRPAAPTPGAVADYRALLMRGEAVVDPETWAGSLPAAYGVPQKVCIGRERWLNLLRLLPVGFVLLLVGEALGHGHTVVPG